MNRIVKKSIYYFLGNLAGKAISIVLIPIYAIYVQTEDLGRSDYIISLSTLLSPILFLAIWEGVLKFGIGLGDINETKRLISSSSIVTVLTSLVILLISSISFAFSSDSSYLFVGLVAITSSFFVTWQYYARSLGKDFVFSMSGVINAAANLLSIMVFIFLGILSSETLIIAILIGQIIGLVYLEYAVKSLQLLNMRSLDFGLILRMYRFTTPLVVNLTFTWFFNGFTRYVTTSFINESTNGLLSFAMKFQMVILMLGTVIGMAVIEEEIHQVNSSLPSTNNFSNTVISVAKLLISTAAIGLPLIYIIFYFISDSHYFDARLYIPALFTTAILASISTAVGSKLQANGMTIEQLISSLIGALFVVTLTYLLIDGITVSMILGTQIVGVGLTLTIRILFVYLRFHVSFDLKKVIAPVVVFAATVYIYLYPPFPLIGYIVLSMIYIALFVLSYRKSLLAFVTNVFRRF